MILETVELDEYYEKGLVKLSNQEQSSASPMFPIATLTVEFLYQASLLLLLSSCRVTDTTASH